MSMMRMTTGFLAAVLAAMPVAAEKAVEADMELGGMSVYGIRELPKSLFVVPWRSPDLGELVGRPGNSLLNESVEPIDREEFMLELEYYEALSRESKK